MVFSTYKAIQNCYPKSWAKLQSYKDFPGSASGKEPTSQMQEIKEMQVILRSARSPLGGHGNPLQYSCLANPMTEEPSGLQSIGSQTVRHDWSDWACMHACKESMGLPRWLRGKESTCQWRRHRRHRFDPWVGKVPWRRKWQSISVFLPGISHGQRGLVGYSPWGHRVGHEWTCMQARSVWGFLWFCFLPISKTDQFSSFFLQVW